MIDRISQAAERLDLEWTAGDPLALAFVVEAADLTGDYLAEVRNGPLPDGDLLGTFTVTATLVDDVDTEFLLEMDATESAGILAGTWWWDLQQTDGPTRKTGHVIVRDQYTEAP